MPVPISRFSLPQPVGTPELPGSPHLKSTTTVFTVKADGHRQQSTEIDFHQDPQGAHDAREIEEPPQQYFHPNIQPMMVPAHYHARHMQPYPYHPTTVPSDNSWAPPPATPFFPRSVYPAQPPNMDDVISQQTQVNGANPVLSVAMPSRSMPTLSVPTEEGQLLSPRPPDTRSFGGAAATASMTGPEAETETEAEMIPDVPRLTSLPTLKLTTRALVSDVLTFAQQLSREFENGRQFSIGDLVLLRQHLGSILSQQTVATDGQSNGQAGEKKGARTKPGEIRSPQYMRLCEITMDDFWKLDNLKRGIFMKVCPSGWTCSDEACVRIHGVWDSDQDKIFKHEALSGDGIRGFCACRDQLLDGICYRVNCGFRHLVALREPLTHAQRLSLLFSYWNRSARLRLSNAPEPILNFSIRSVTDEPTAISPSRHIKTDYTEPHVPTTPPSAAAIKARLKNVSPTRLKNISPTKQSATTPSPSVTKLATGPANRVPLVAAAATSPCRKSLQPHRFRQSANGASNPASPAIVNTPVVASRPIFQVASHSVSSQMGGINVAVAPSTPIGSGEKMLEHASSPTGMSPVAAFWRASPSILRPLSQAESATPSAWNQIGPSRVDNIVQS